MSIYQFSRTMGNLCCVYAVAKLSKLASDPVQDRGALNDPRALKALMSRNLLAAKLNDSDREEASKQRGKPKSFSLNAIVNIMTYLPLVEAAVTQRGLSKLDADRLPLLLKFITGMETNDVEALLSPEWVAALRKGVTARPMMLAPIPKLRSQWALAFVARIVNAEALREVAAELKNQTHARRRFNCMMSMTTINFDAEEDSEEERRQERRWRRAGSSDFSLVLNKELIRQQSVRIYDFENYFESCEDKYSWPVEEFRLAAEAAGVDLGVNVVTHYLTFKTLFQEAVKEAWRLPGKDTDREQLPEEAYFLYLALFPAAAKVERGMEKAHGNTMEALLKIERSLMTQYGKLFAKALAPNSLPKTL